MVASGAFFPYRTEIQELWAKGPQHPGFCLVFGLWAVVLQRAQYPSIKEYTLNHRGLNIMIEGIFLN